MFFCRSFRGWKSLQEKVVNILPGKGSWLGEFFDPNEPEDYWEEERKHQAGQSEGSTFRPVQILSWPLETRHFGADYLLLLGLVFWRFCNCLWWGCGVWVFYSGYGHIKHLARFLKRVLDEKLERIWHCVFDSDVWSPCVFSRFVKQTVESKTKSPSKRSKSSELRDVKSAHSARLVRSLSSALLVVADFCLWKSLHYIKRFVKVDWKRPAGTVHFGWNGKTLVCYLARFIQLVNLVR